ncbi:MAG: hypothetical protein VYC18_00140, partial [Pseudomonadota bacterium]|nr:hypothetical protein [Pseudomonadota bacterium]
MIVLKIINIKRQTLRKYNTTKNNNAVHKLNGLQRLLTTASRFCVLEYPKRFEKYVMGYFFTYRKGYVFTIIFIAFVAWRST